MRCQRLIAAFVALIFAASGVSSTDVSDLRPDGTPKRFVSAHRGGPMIGLPENTIAAMDHTLKAGVQLFEVDVSATADGKLILFHDRTMTRLMGQEGRINLANWEDIKQTKLLDFNGDLTEYTLNTLDEALVWSVQNDVIIQLDIKIIDLLNRVITAVETHNAMKNSVFIAYTLDTATTMQQADPDIFVSLPLYNEQMITAAEDKGIDFTRAFAWTGTRNFTGDINSAIQAKDMLVAFGTLGRRGKSYDHTIASPCIYMDFIKKGVNIIATDFPRTVQAVFNGELGCS